MKLHTTRSTILAAATLVVCAGVASLAGCSRTRVEGQTLNVENSSKTTPSRDRQYNRTRIRVTLPGENPAPLPATPRHRFDDAPGSPAATRSPMSWTDDVSAFGADEIVTLGLFGAQDEEPAPFGGGSSRVKINGHEIVVPNGATIDVDVEQDSDKTGAAGDSLRKGASKGASLDAPGDASIEGFGTGAAELSLGGVDRRGNESHGSASSSGASLEDITGSKSLNFFHLIGGAAMLVALAVLWIGRNVRLAAIIGGLGLASIAIGALANTLGAWGGIAILGAFVVAGCAAAYFLRGDANAKESLAKVVRAVESLGPRGEPVKATIKAQTKADGSNERVRRAVAKTKKSMGILNVPAVTTTTPPGMDASGASAIGAAPQSGLGAR